MTYAKCGKHAKHAEIPLARDERKQYTRRKGERFCVCGVPWEEDMDQFGCWSCGASEPDPNNGIQPTR